ncbi:hypothetical protein Dimus_000461 [Dionaea muscipula]
MGSYRRFEIIDHPSPLPSIFEPKALSISHYLPPFVLDDDDEGYFHYALEILNHHPKPTPALFDFASRFHYPAALDVVTTDLVQIETAPFYKRYQQLRRVDRLGARKGTDLYLESLRDRVAELESKFDKLLLLKGKGKGKGKGNGKGEEEGKGVVERKYTWTAEIKDGVERKYKWTAEIKGEEGKKEKKKEKKIKHGESDGVGERNYKWMAEIKGKDDEKRTYTWKATIGGDSSKFGKEKEVKGNKKKEEGESSVPKIVEIEEEPPFEHGAVILRQAFAKRSGAAINKGKKKELSPQDAALMIQISFREYLIRRSRALRALRELAVAKTKLKEIRALFHNFSYRNRIVRDAEERQKFSEKIIVLLLTVEAIEGADLMVRTAKKSMVDELEAMLDVIDPHPAGGSLSIKRRTFDMPSGDLQMEIAEGVANVVQMLDG